MRKRKRKRGKGEGEKKKEAHTDSLFVFETLTPFVVVNKTQIIPGISKTLDLSDCFFLFLLLGVRLRILKKKKKKKKN